MTTSAAALGVGRQRLPQFLRESQVIHHEPARFVLEHTVYARDRLHQAVSTHRLVQVHCVQARAIEASKPHVTENDDFERVVGVTETICEEHPTLLVADMWLPVRGIRGRTSHNDLDLAFVVIFMVPLRA